MTEYRYEEIGLDELGATDLHEEAAKAIGQRRIAIRGVELDADGYRKTTHFEALWFPDINRLGVAYGSDAAWADADTLDSGLTMYFNDGEEWAARN